MQNSRWFAIPGKTSDKFVYTHLPLGLTTQTRSKQSQWDPVFRVPDYYTRETLDEYFLNSNIPKWNDKLNNLCEQELTIAKCGPTLKLYFVLA